jgi:hypothetical protein
LIGGNVDLDLLSLFPQDLARIMGGGGEREQSFKVNNGGERKSQKLTPLGKKGALYRSPHEI